MTQPIQCPLMGEYRCAAPPSSSGNKPERSRDQPMKLVRRPLSHFAVAVVDEPARASQGLRHEHGLGK